MSRGRKKSKSRPSGERILRSVAPLPPDVCDCPECSGASVAMDGCDCPECSGGAASTDVDFDPQELINSLVAGGTDVLDSDDPLDAELLIAGFLAAGNVVGDGFAEVLAGGIVPDLAELASPAALAVLAALDAVAGTPASAAAVQRLTVAGVAAPKWSNELREPVRIGQCQRFADAEGNASILVCSFDRAGRSHGFMINIDHLDCDAAADIALFPAAILDQALAAFRSDGGGAGLAITEESLDPAEFRWQVERAVDARAVHDQELDAEELAEEFDDDEGLGYHVLAILLRARLRALPEPSRPPAPHGAGDDAVPPAATDMLAEFLARQALPQQTGSPRRRSSGPKLPAKRTKSGPKLPAKRTKSGPPAPIYQVKVSLRGTKPPIWRRLELPADTSLAGLHDIIQVAFDWDDAHLHVFETEYGPFGTADDDLGHRAEGPVTLEQVAPGAGDSLEYTYDFGDNWTHDIVVEKVLDRRPVAYPRCTGGRRAGPPEDCGGPWGYAELIEVLGDPGHPEHEDRLEWLCLDSAADFQPGQFDPAEITRMLAGQD